MIKTNQYLYGIIYKNVSFALLHFQEIVNNQTLSLLYLLTVPSVPKNLE